MQEIDDLEEVGVDGRFIFKMDYIDIGLGV
jgi:hypothetical protein